VEVFLPEVYEAELPRVCWRVDPSLVLGKGVLRFAASKGELTCGGGQGAGLQVDQDNLEVGSKTRTLYNEATYLESLRKRNSPLLKYAATNP
jgi:hypothetical protein